MMMSCSVVMRVRHAVSSSEYNLAVRLQLQSIDLCQVKNIYGKNLSCRLSREIRFGGCCRVSRLPRAPLFGALSLPLRSRSTPAPSLRRAGHQNFSQLAPAPLQVYFSRSYTNPLQTVLSASISIIINCRKLYLFYLVLFLHIATLQHVDRWRQAGSQWPYQGRG